MTQMASTQQQRRAYWLKTLHQWHWISSALCLLRILVFSFTGITLNHAAQIESQPRITEKQEQMPASLLNQLSRAAGPKDAPLPASVREWLDQALSVRVGARPAEWSEEEVYIALPRPGGDAWVNIDLESGEVSYEHTDRGWIS